jgi:DNA-binding transcriptional MerR regulator
MQHIITIDKAAKLLSVTVKTLQRWDREGIKTCWTNRW